MPSKDALIAEAEQIIASAKADGRELTEADESRFDDLMAQVDSIDAKAKSDERARALAGRLESVKASASAPVRRVPSGSSAPTTTASVVREGFEDDPKRGFKSHREFLSTVRGFSTGDRSARADARLKFLATAGSDEQGEYAPEYGGFLVPAAWQPGVLKVANEADPTAAFTRKIPMTSPTVKINARVDKNHSSSVSGGLRVYRRAEADTASSSRMQFEQITLQATSLFGIAYATEELLTDSPESFTALIADGFADEFAATKLKEKLNGVGGGEFVGVRNAACAIDVTKESGQAASTIVYENVLNMYARAWNPQMWLASKTCIPQLAAMSLTVGVAGSAVWAPSAQPGLPGTLFGLPIYYSEHMQTLGTSGDIMLCNWGEYLEGTLGSMGQEESIHVRFVNHERCFKFYERNAGAPWWSSALTPDNGDTLSPFVTLATRA